jgi:Ctf8
MNPCENVVVPIVHDTSCCDKEWTMLELNGELVMPVDLPTENNPQSVVLGPDHLELGSLHYHDATTLKMILGSHEMKGNLQTLKEPFCVLEKQTNSNEEGEETQYRVAGIVTQKVLFNNYPKTIMK